jgi:histidine ammonia-lyase
MIRLDGRSLTIEGLLAIAEGGEIAVLDSPARDSMAQGRRVVLDAIEAGKSVYGATTGVAERKRIPLDPQDRGAFANRLVESHRVAQGPPAERTAVRAAMACLANSFATGRAGVRPELAELFVEALRDNFEPRVRSLGSVGQSDIGPMADLAHEVLQRANFVLECAEGLPLVSSNAFSTALAALAIRSAERFLESACAAAALDLEAFAGNLSSLDESVYWSRPLPGVDVILETMHRLLDGSGLWDEGTARFLQDPMTFRSIPQVNGAARGALDYARTIVETELNSFQGNPAIDLEHRRVIPLANFDAVAMSAALDFVRIAMATVINASSERTVKLLQEPASGLPSGLAPTLNSGSDALAELAVASQSLTVQARMLAQPVSFEPTSSYLAEGIEDRSTMAPLSAQRLDEMVYLGARVVAIELAVSCQAVDVRDWGGLGSGTGEVYTLVRRHVPFADGATPPQHLDPLVDLVRLGLLTA